MRLTLRLIFNVGDKHKQRNVGGYVKKLDRRGMNCLPVVDCREESTGEREGGRGGWAVVRRQAVRTN